MKYALEAALAVAVLVLPGIGQAADKPVTADQEQMCSGEASSRDLKGEPRQRFMSACLKGASGMELTAQQEKMNTCNHEASAKELKGDARRRFMSACLKGQGSASAGR